MSAVSRQVRRWNARKGERVMGFTPVRNERLATAHGFQVVALVEAGVKAHEAERQAWANVAKTLPPPRMVADHRQRPSKSDDPKYRKPFVRDFSKARGEP